MDSIERGVLEVCQEVVLRQREMLPLLAMALQVPEHQVFYTWAFRHCEQRGRLKGTEWSYFFHGLECDLTNGTDGRFLRMDFGPQGRVDTFTAWGILQFLLTSVPPWKDAHSLQTYFGKGAPPFDCHSGLMEKLSPIWVRLEAKGMFERADPSLVELAAKYISRGADGLSTVRFPPEITDETRLDCMVARRQRLSARALQLLEMDPQDCLSR